VLGTAVEDVFTAYLDGPGLRLDPWGPLFRTIGQAPVT
jgi:hypothetical protein